MKRIVGINFQAIHGMYFIDHYYIFIDKKIGGTGGPPYDPLPSFDDFSSIHRKPLIIMWFFLNLFFVTETSKERLYPKSRKGF